MESTSEGKRERKGIRRPGGVGRRAKRLRGHSHSFEVRRKAVQLCLEEGFPVPQVAREMGVGRSTLTKWIKVYRDQGEAGLQSKPIRRNRPPAKVAPAVKAQVVELKRQHPELGVKRISQFLRRVLFLPVSRETVRRTLHEQQLLKKPRRKPQRNPARPRFFERSTPNQMWQSDIFTFRLGGKNAYLIGFLDDYSRYLVGLDVFRSQTAEHVLEVYRRAVAEYGVPKEMLTDQGRQYSSWRGTTRFEAELRKDRVHHIKSRPHHPMTLGKIERFWKTIWEEFLERAQFDSFESACERVRLWVKHYNHRRPHQSLEGLCPADRFFAIAKELRQVIERGIQDNVLEMALRGQPHSPFYMVGRMGEQSVVIRAEKGQVKMLVDGEEPRPHQEVVYDLKGGSHVQRSESQEGTIAVQCSAASPGGAVDLERTPAAGASLPGNVDQPRRAMGLGEAGTGGDAQGPGFPNTPGTGTGVEPETATVAGQSGPAAEGTHGQTGETTRQASGAESAAAEQIEQVRMAGGFCNEQSEAQCTQASDSPAAGAADHAGSERTAERSRSCTEDEGLPQNLLQMGAACAGGHDRGTGLSGSGASIAADRPGQTGPPMPDPEVGGEARSPGTDRRYPPPVGEVG
jgi:transposase InsO family protein